MYPPSESAPVAASSVYFEPLPDPAKLQRHYRSELMSNATGFGQSNCNLRPKIALASDEAKDQDNCDIVDKQHEILKFERLIGESDCCIYLK